MIMDRKHNRRQFLKTVAEASAALSLYPGGTLASTGNFLQGLRLGGPLFGKFDGPEEWIAALQSLGYRAAYCPLEPGAGSREINAYRKAAQKAGIVISEVGTWSNTISPEEPEMREAIGKCIKGLQLADEIGANCCVNISGSRNRAHWAGPHKDNLTTDTFDLIVENTRKIIDAVKPVQTYFALEAMPWAIPHTPGEYVDLIKAIDRDRFAAHLDPVNFITSPEIYFRNGDMIRECFRQFGPYIRSCHAKDITLREDIYTPHLTEVRPGLGNLDYRVYLHELSKLKDIPLMMEHLETAAQYEQAAEYIRDSYETDD